MQLSCSVCDFVCPCFCDWSARQRHEGIAIDFLVKYNLHVFCVCVCLSVAQRLRALLMCLNNRMFKIMQSVIIQTLAVIMQVKITSFSKKWCFRS